nr:O-antigen ligase family protein [uncultured Acetatifactor sp.]
MSGIKKIMLLFAMINLVVAVNICEPIKNIYFMFYIGIGILAIMAIVSGLKSFGKNEVMFCFLCIMMFFLPRIYSDSFFSLDGGILKYDIYILLLLFLAFNRLDEIRVVPILSVVGYIHVIATYAFLLLPIKIYQNFAKAHYRKFPQGTEGGVKGYTAALNSHYSSNALYIAVTVLALWASYLAGNRKNKKTILPLFIMAFGALILTEKRGHLLFCIGSIIFSYYVYNREGIAKIVKRIFEVIIVLIPMYLVVGMIFPSAFRVLNRFSGLFSGKDISNGRFHFWLVAIKLFFSHPLRGIGWEKYMDVAKIYHNVHNVYLQLLCETGIIGLLIFLGFILNNFITIHKINKDRFFYYLPSNIKLNLIFSEVIQIFFILYCLTGNCLYDNTLFFYCVGTGIGLATQNVIRLYKSEVYRKVL